MKTYHDPEPPGGRENPLKGLGQKLKLHFIIPCIYAVVLIAIYIMTHGK